MLFDGTPTATSRLLLRPPTLADADAIFATYASDPEVTRYLTWRTHRSTDETRAFLESCAAGWRNRTSLSWTLRHAHGGDAIGMIACRLEGHRANVGYVLARAEWGKGLMTEALCAVRDAAFATPTIRRVWAFCDVDNVGSCRVMDKSGMTHEGILRKFVVHPNLGDEPRDAHCYAVVR